MQNTAAWVSLAFTIGAYILYYFYFKRDRKRPLAGQKFPPSKVTWLIWCGVDGIIASAMLAGHDFAPQMWVYVVGAAAISTYDFTRDPNHFKFSPNDKWVLAFAGVAMCGWFIASYLIGGEVGNITAIAVSLLAVVIGSVPLWQAAWEKPEVIPGMPWALFLIGGIFGVISSVQLHGWTWVDDLGPCSFLVFQVLTLSLALGVSRFFPKRPATA